MKKIRLGFLIVVFFLVARPIMARENVTDWYIKDFQTEITVNKDSSLDITEKITADCSQAPDKHGIFRILPETINFPGEKVKTPVELVSITDFSNAPLKYSQSKNYSDNTVTWKIGDPNRTVTGINEYRIRYRVKNAIQFGSSEFDEFYWNLNGNFWELETDNFVGKIIFPPEISQNNSIVDYYTGQLGSRHKNLANYRWSSDNILEFNSLATLEEGEGITVSVTFPKSIATPYQAGLVEIYGRFLYFLFPIFVFIFVFRNWKKYGKDPKIRKTVIAGYDPPGNLEPMEMGMLSSNGTFDNNFITAEIINLAVKGILSIKETNTKILLFNLKDYKLEKKYGTENEKKLNSTQKKILREIFKKGNSVKLSDLKTTFHSILDDIEKDCRDMLIKKDLLAGSGHKYRINFTLAGIALVVMSVALLIFAPFISGYLALNLGVSGVIFFIFGLIMPKRTSKGAELNWEIKGFKLFMETAEKFRVQFYEKENIFEKILPYAIIFDMTKEWIKKMEKIYGADFYANHAPAWYVGNMASFNAGNFSDSIENLSKSIATNSSSSSSGAGGHGSSGGGGGGGGGGGW